MYDYSKFILKMYLQLLYMIYCMSTVCKQYFRFGAFEELKRFNVDENGNLSPTKRMLCGLGKNHNSYFKRINQAKIYSHSK